MKSYLEPQQPPRLSLKMARWQILQKCQKQLILALKGYSMPKKLSHCDLFMQVLDARKPLFKAFDAEESEVHELHLELNLQQAAGKLLSDGPEMEFILPPEACQMYKQLDASFAADLVQQVNLSVALAHKQAGE